MKTTNIISKPKFWLVVIISVLFVGVPFLLGCDDGSPALKKQQEIQEQQLEQQRQGEQKKQEELERQRRQQQLEQMNNIPFYVHPV